MTEREHTHELSVSTTRTGIALHKSIVARGKGQCDRAYDHLYSATMHMGEASGHFNSIVGRGGAVLSKVANEYKRVAYLHRHEVAAVKQCLLKGR